MPRQMANPRPVFPPRSSPSTLENLRDRWGRCRAGVPGPSSDTATATCSSSAAALIRMVDVSDELRPALAIRLPNTCTSRRRLAITQGNSGARSVSTAWRPPPARKALHGSAISTPRSVGSGDTADSPISMRATP